MTALIPTAPRTIGVSCMSVGDIPSVSQMPVSCETQSFLFRKARTTRSLGLNPAAVRMIDQRINFHTSQLAALFLEGSRNSRRWDQAGGCRSLEVGPQVYYTWTFHFSLLCKHLSSITCPHSHHVCPGYTGTDNHGLNSLKPSTKICPP